MLKPTIEQWVIQYSSQLLRSAISRVNDKGTAKDLAQGVFRAA